MYQIFGLRPNGKGGLKHKDMNINIKTIDSIFSDYTKVIRVNETKSGTGEDYNLFYTAGSDAHSTNDFLREVTAFDKKINNEKDFLLELQAGRFNIVSYKEMFTLENAGL